MFRLRQRLSASTPELPQLPYDPMLGQLGEATVSKRIAYHSPGRVYYRATWWKAQCQHRDLILEPGTRVQVVARDITILIVEPCWN
ncbi:NfeD family protein [Phormidium yuhuli AB48]|uniref:NfeD family protein n=1 Tax=Phormidium yuhuli AB48 TaxID=2940671 RepID=A0ABY5ALJ9_9CYAN|nr:NfeD family protein [Phormidium yuhuli]USR89631.1 NfeD family protein [Phormidium yuhuli AB48]